MGEKGEEEEEMTPTLRRGDPKETFYQMLTDWSCRAGEEEEEGGKSQLMSLN